jgi:hypothetical protein
MTNETMGRVDSIIGWLTLALASLALGIPVVTYILALAK